MWPAAQIILRPFTMIPTQKMLLAMSFLSLVMSHKSQAISDYQRAEMPPSTLSQCPSKRSLFNIVWTCLLTSFWCSWVSVHPNIPPKGEWGWIAVWRRLKLMFWAFVTPELIIAWAVRQWFAAKEIADTYNRHKGLISEEGSFFREWLAGDRNQRGKVWSRIHGHFLIMGGFILSEPELPTDNDTARENPSSRDTDPTAQWAEGLNVALDTVRACHHDPTSGTVQGDDGSDAQVLTAPLPTVKLDGSRQPAMTPGSAIDHHYPENTGHPRQETLCPFEAQTSGLNRDPLPVSDHPYTRQPTASSPSQTTVTIVPEGQRSESSNLKYPWFLTYDMMEKLLKIEDLDFEISISEDEIEDKSKSDVIAKVIVGLQVIGFIVQCAARLHQDLFLTHLEIVTFALATQNVVMYFFWLEKPLNVKSPMRVKLKRKLTDQERRLSDSDATEPLLWIFYAFKARFKAQLKITKDNIVRIVRNSPSENLVALNFRWFVALPFFILCIVSLGIGVIIGAYLPISLLHIIFTGDIRTNSLHVPTFYAPRTKRRSILHFAWLALCSITFSGLHLGGWHSIHLDATSLLVWRALSLGMVFALPTAILTTYFLAKIHPDSGGNVTAGNPSDGPQIVMFVPTQDQMLLGLEQLLLYVVVLARVTLVLSALNLLRNLPVSAFCEVDWTRFYPSAITL